jgi:uncharacterized surface protein with fasciclin (FAS1) repeats
MIYRLRSLTSAAALALALGALAACNPAEKEADDASATVEAPADTGATASTSTSASTSATTEAPMVGGAAMLPSRNIVQNASEASNLTTLVSAVTAADLGGTLSGPGPFTVFAPTNDAFGKLPDGTVQTLTQPAQKKQLSGILTYHVVPGNLTAAELTRQMEAGGGTATLTTVNGAKLMVRAANGGVQLTDAAGKTAMVTQADVKQSNGVVHVIDTVLTPAKG